MHPQFFIDRKEMSSLLRFTPLSGARTPTGPIDPNHRKGYRQGVDTQGLDVNIKVERQEQKAFADSNINAAPCYLLEIDEAKILLDCGWSDNFDLEDLKTLKR